MNNFWRQLMNIIIGADIVPTKTNFKAFEKGDMKEIVGLELLDILNNSDYNIFNLETPLTDVPAPIHKNGPNLIAATKCINGYKALGIDLLTVANNHIMDQGVIGLDSTLSVLDKNEIAYVGAGENLYAAQKPYIFELNNTKIGVYACAEHEFSIASDSMPGANPFDPLESFDHVTDLKQKCDKVIVLYHGGKEHYRYPSPYLQKVCRKFIEKGADILICQHSHCIGCEEKYLNGTIVYGQGNFLFGDYDSEFWQTSLLILIDENFEIKYIPLEKTGNGIRLAESERANEIINEFYKRSNEIKDKDFVKNNYDEFSNEMIDGYLFGSSGIKYNFFMKVINKLCCGSFIRCIVEKQYPLRKLLAMLNYLECEAHKELFVTGLKNKISNKK